MKIRNILSTIILILVLSITVGFSAFVSEMSISNIVADIRMQEDIRVTSVELVDGYEIISNEIDYDVDSVLGNVSFNSYDAIATYKITVTNIGNVDVYLNGYTYSGNVNVEPLDGTTQTVVSALGGTNEFSLMIYPSEYTNSYSSNFKIDFSFKNIYSVSYENLNLENRQIIDGESYSEFIGDFDSNDIQVYMGGRQLSSNEYSYSYGQLIVNSVTGNLIIKLPRKLYNEIKLQSITNDSSIDFGTNVGSGVYEVTSTALTEFPIYFYRGEVFNNNVLFANFCWKIVRTTDTGGVKLIYNGVPSSGKCITTSPTIGKSLFNTNQLTNSAVAEDLKYIYSDGTDSIIKKTIDDWYENNLINYEEKLEDTVWCSDFTVISDSDGYSYAANNRVGINAYSQKVANPSLFCPEDYSFVVNTSDISKKLKYPIGMLTADEMSYIGAVFLTKSLDNFYLNDGVDFWLMTPFLYDPDNAGNVWAWGSAYVQGNLYPGGNPFVSKELNVRPAVSLKKGILILRGDGSNSNPFVIE